MYSNIPNIDQLNSWVNTYSNINLFLPSLSRNFTASALVTAGQGVCIDNTGKVYPYVTADTDKYIGIAARNTDGNGSTYVVLKGVLYVQNSGWAAGNVYYISNGGNISTAPGDMKVAVGIAKDTILVYTDLSGGGSTATDYGYAKSLMLMGG